MRTYDGKLYEIPHIKILKEPDCFKIEPRLALKEKDTLTVQELHQLLSDWLVFHRDEKDTPIIIHKKGIKGKIEKMREGYINLV